MTEDRERGSTRGGVREGAPDSGDWLGAAGIGQLAAAPKASPASCGSPSRAQAAYLRRGLVEPGGKLPLFDRQGQRYKARTIRSCVAQGWAEPWFHNPTKPDWLVCRLTDAGRAALAEWEKSETLVALPGHDRPAKSRPRVEEFA